jgi:hypothetical protein
MIATALREPNNFETGGLEARKKNCMIAASVKIPTLRAASRSESWVISGRLAYGSSGALFGGQKNFHKSKLQPTFRHVLRFTFQLKQTTT